VKVVYRVVGMLFVLASAVFAAGQTGGLASDPGVPAQLTCSPAPCVLPPIQASEGGGEVTDTPIVADPLNRQHLLLGSVDANCPQPSTSGFHISADGGSTWSRHCMPVLLNFKGRVYYPGGQPMVAYDLGGTAYIADTYGDSEGLGYGLVGVQKSIDGTHWTGPMVTLSEGYAFPSESWMKLDTSPSSPYSNTVYISAVILNGFLTKDEVVVSHSTDGGQTWTVAPVTPLQGGYSQDLFTNLSVGKDGTVYMTWQHCPGAGPSAGCQDGTGYMVFSKSTDGGNTWSTPALVTVIATNKAEGQCQCGISTLPNTNEIRVYDYPVVGVDNSDGPYAGSLYVVMQTWTGTHLQVQVVRSVDGGNTWSRPILVAPASDTHDQFFPWLSVSPSGLVGVSWLDRRNDPANIDYQAFAAISTNGGQSFQPNVQLTTQFSNPNNNGYPDNGWMGDYSGNTWDGANNFIAAWMDSSNGVDMQEVVGGIRLK